MTPHILQSYPISGLGVASMTSNSEPYSSAIEDTSTIARQNSLNIIASENDLASLGPPNLWDGQWDTGTWQDAMHVSLP